MLSDFSDVGGACDFALLRQNPSCIGTRHLSARHLSAWRNTGRPQIGHDIGHWYLDCGVLDGTLAASVLGELGIFLLYCLADLLLGHCLVVMFGLLQVVQIKWRYYTHDLLSACPNSIIDLY